MLKLDNVTKIFKQKKKEITAASHLSFQVKPGEVFGLIGTNGAGKTTVMRMIATTLKPTAGKIFVMKKNVAENPDFTRKNIGILFGGDTGIYDRLSARENIEFFAKLNGLSKEQIKIEVEKLVKFFNMQDYIDRPAGKFSKGMKQKVCFARAIVHNPPVMLLDEPTSGLDVIAAEEVLSFIKDLKDKKKTVLLSSHNMAEVTELCDRVAIIKNGFIIAEGTIPALLKKFHKKDMKTLFLFLTEEAGEI